MDVGTQALNCLANPSSIFKEGGEQNLIRSVNVVLEKHAISESGLEEQP